MTIQTVGAILLFSDEPERLLAFYRNRLGIPIEEETHPGAARHYGGRVGDTHFAIHHSRLNRGRPGVAFSLGTLDLEQYLSQHDVQPLHRPIPMGNGACRTTIKDPDGNTVSLVQLADDWARRPR